MMLVLIVLYILIKDVTVPLIRRLQTGRNMRNNGNPGTSSSGELHVFMAESQARWDEQRRTNERFEGNLRRVFERLDALKK